MRLLRYRIRLIDSKSPVILSFSRNLASARLRPKDAISAGGYAGEKRRQKLPLHTVSACGYGPS
jgi:hypothetical protein